MDQIDKKYQVADLISRMNIVTQTISVGLENLQIYIDIADNEETSVSSKEEFDSRASVALDMIADRQKRLGELITEMRAFTDAPEFK